MCQRDNSGHDYWGTRIVDRETAISLATKAGQDRKQAEAEIDAWLESSCHATEITMPAGTYHLYWDDDRETLDAMPASPHPKTHASCSHASH